MRFKLRLSSFVLIIFILACSNINYLLPKDYNIQKEVSFSTSLDNIKIYNISIDSIKIKDLIKYPKISSGKYMIYKWEKYEDIYKKERIRILGIVKESNEYSKNENISELIKLLQQKQNVYFSAFYTEIPKVSGKSSNFYDSMYFIDVVNKKLYEIKHIYDY